MREPETSPRPEDGDVRAPPDAGTGSEAGAPSATGARSPGTIPGTSLDLRTLSYAVIAGIWIVLFLRFAQQVFVPLAIGVVVSYALEPIVAWLKKRSIPRPAGAALLLFALLGFTGFGVNMLLDDAVQVVEKLPEAARKLRESVRATHSDSDGLIQKVQKAATEMENTTTAAVGSEAARKGVMRVQIEEKPINVGDYLWRGGSGLISVGSQAALVLFLVYFILISGDLFKRKMMKLAGTSHVGRQLTTQILDDIDTQIARYMLIQVMTSTIVGVTSGFAFWMMGLEQPAIWALVVGLLDTIPYFGPSSVMVGLFTIGYLQFGTIMMGLYLAGVAGIIMSVEGFLLTPWLTMKAVRMNGVALFLGLMFWGWMWGIWGVLLAVPMMVIIKSISDRIESLKPIGELLGA